uniref:Uncharacterized protein n=1 Tax=Anguilla anguilla TaxID=7936 RepID=A0A0E9TPS4_ANGAN
MGRNPQGQKHRAEAHATKHNQTQPRIQNLSPGEGNLNRTKH